MALKKNSMKQNQDEKNSAPTLGKVFLERCQREEDKGMMDIISKEMANGKMKRDVENTRYI